MVAHLAVSYFCYWWRTKRFEPNNITNRVFDSATFSSSGLLLLGIYDPTVLTLIGSTKLFLLIAGVGGFLYGFHPMFK